MFIREFATFSNAYPVSNIRYNSVGNIGSLEILELQSCSEAIKHEP